MDRVTTLKGTAVNEKALIMRLHLLQAVQKFHQNNRNEARRLLSLAEMELVQLQVDEQSVSSLTEMGKLKPEAPNESYDTFLFCLEGFTNAEARVGLRATANNIERAIAFIEERRQQRKQARKVGAAQRKATSSLLTKKTDKWINPKNLHLLIEMGFEKNLCAIALRKTNNDINQAVIPIALDKSGRNFY